MSYKVRIRFSKLDHLRFIGHLDLLRLFQRSIRIAGLPISYSQGFNPHPLLFFALPLSVGLGGYSEYADAVFDEAVEGREIVARLAPCMPSGLTILGCRELRDGEKGCAAATEAALYRFDCSGGGQGDLLLDEVICTVMERPHIHIAKKTKKGVKTVDIRQDIFHMKSCSPTVFQALIAAGSGRNLKAELLAEYCLRVGSGEDGQTADADGTEVAGLSAKVRIERLDLLQSSEKGFVSLFEYDPVGGSQHSEATTV